MELTTLDIWRQAGIYAGRILKGAKRLICRAAADENSSWLSSQDRQGAWPYVPPSILARADEVIE